MFSKVTLLVAAAAALSELASAATIKITAQAIYTAADPFEFSPNNIQAAVGDILEFHFAGPGNGIIDSNHSVAQGDWSSACVPKPNGGFFSGNQYVNATKKEAPMNFQVRVNDTNPIVFYCTTGQHCTRGMHGVVNGAGAQTLAAYRSSITVNKVGVPPTTVGGGVFANNSEENQTPPPPTPAEVPAAPLLILGFTIFVMAGLFSVISR